MNSSAGGGASCGVPDGTVPDRRPEKGVYGEGGGGLKEPPVVKRGWRRGRVGV